MAQEVAAQRQNNPCPMLYMPQVEEPHQEGTEPPGACSSFRYVLAPFGWHLCWQASLLAAEGSSSPPTGLDRGHPGLDGQIEVQITKVQWIYRPKSFGAKGSPGVRAYSMCCAWPWHFCLHSWSGSFLRIKLDHRGILPELASLLGKSTTVWGHLATTL